MKCVIWAVDAFDSNTRLQKTISQLMTFLKNQSTESEGVGDGFIIKPVYVLNAGQLNLSEESSGPFIHYYLPAAKKALSSIVEDMNLSCIERPHVILQRTSSTAEAADLLSRFAQANKADLIVVGTHGRSGVRRLMLGSFAETLMLRSRIPVLVASPEMKRLAQSKTVIFPTDFGPSSQAVFRKAVGLAQDFDSKIILFHSIPHPVEPILQSGVYLFGGGAWIPLQSYFGKELDRQTRHAKAWTRWAKSQGVAVEFVIDSIGKPISKQIEELAIKHRAWCIVMEPQTGPVAAALIGSIARQVIRHAPCPVWVHKPPVLRAIRSVRPQRVSRKAA